MIHVFLICLACCCSSLMPLKQSESIVSEDHIQAVEKKKKENYVRTSSGYYEYGLSDIASYDFLVGFADYLVDTYNLPELSYSSNSRVTNFVIQSSNTYKVYYYYIGSKEYVLGIDVANIVVNKTYANVNDTSDYPVLLYQLTFGNSSPYNRQITFQWNAQRTSDNRLTIWGFEISNVSADLESSGTGSAVYWYARFMLSEKEDSNTAFFKNIFNNIKGNPYNNGYNAGYQEGYSLGVSSVVDNPNSSAYQTIFNAGYQSGYSTGMAEGIDTNSLPATIFTGIINVGLLPVNVFLQMFNYEVFGVNIAGLISSLLTIAVVIIVIRVVTGKKNV